MFYVFVGLLVVVSVCCTCYCVLKNDNLKRNGNLDDVYGPLTAISVTLSIFFICCFILAHERTDIVNYNPKDVMMKDNYILVVDNDFGTYLTHDARVVNGIKDESSSITITNRKYYNIFGWNIGNSSKAIFTSGTKEEIEIMHTW